MLTTQQVKTPQPESGGRQQTCGFDLISGAPLQDDIECVSWLDEVGMTQYAETFLVNFTVGGRGFLSRKRLSMLRLQDFPMMNITNYEHQKLLLQHIRHTLKYSYQSPVRIQETQQSAFAKARQKALEVEAQAKIAAYEAKSSLSKEFNEPEYGSRQGSRASLGASHQPSAGPELAASKELNAEGPAGAASASDDPTRSRAGDLAVEVANKSQDAIEKKKKARRRHTFDDKAWEAINKSRAVLDTKSSLDYLREGMAAAPPQAPSVKEEVSERKPPPRLRRRRTYDELEEALANPDKGQAYGNLVQEFNLIQKEFIAVKETQLHEFMSIVGCEIASILLINDRTSELVFLVDDSKWISIPMTQGLAAHCVRSGEMLNIPDAYADSRFNRNVDLMTGTKTRNMICAPIRAVRSGGNIVGVVQMINKCNGGTFDKNDEGVLAVCVERVADDIYSVFRELLRVNDLVSAVGKSFFPAASETRQASRLLKSTASSNKLNLNDSKLVRQPSSNLDSIEQLRKKYLSFEVPSVNNLNLGSVDPDAAQAK